MVSLAPVPSLQTSRKLALATKFRELGLSREYIRRMTGRGDDLRTALTPTRETLLRDESATIALRLFFCQQPESRELASEALGAELLDSLCEAGVLRSREDGLLYAPFHLRLVKGLLLFSDYLGSGADEVMGAGETTGILYQVGRPEKRIGRVLDLGCGAGTLALLLAADAEQAVGTDINPRAIELARFNAAVNGIGNAEFRVGDVYEPVRGEAFDLILSQPPYYPNPSGDRTGKEQTFLHGGIRGDEIAKRVLDGIPAHLTPSGEGIVFASWPNDSRPHCSDSLEIVDLMTNRRELHGTRQSITVIRHAESGAGWTAAVSVPADFWGDVQPWRIDQIAAAERLVRGPRERLLDAQLRLPEGATVIREGAELLLRCPSESLVGLTAIGDEQWRILSTVDRSPDVRTALEELTPPAMETIERALRAGWLVTPPSS